SATSEEMRDLVAKLPASLGINWDQQNSLSLERDVFPGGYHKLPKNRIENVQIKAEGLFGAKKLDWAAIIQALLADGYKGLFALETHHGQGEQNYRMSVQAMNELARIAASL
ncbi:MAG: hypothetical protein HYZ37_12050, partial [Candidatus Solibacter usitatus]|nr:hypothetical protein [Candidatus Solibacter usitatus]